MKQTFRRKLRFSPQFPSLEVAMHAFRMLLIVSLAWSSAARVAAQDSAENKTRMMVSVEMSAARLRQHYGLQSGKVVDAANGFAAVLGAGVRWGSVSFPDVQAVLLAGAGRPYRAYTAGAAIVPRSNGVVARLAMGVIERPDPILQVPSGDVSYETPERLGFAAEVGYTFVMGESWRVGPTLTWISSRTEQQLSQRHELLALGLALRFR